MPSGWRGALVVGAVLAVASTHAAGQETGGSKSPPLPPPRPPADRAEVFGPPIPNPEPKDASAANPDGDTCPSRLAKLGARFEPRPALQEGSCGGGDIVMLTGLPGGVAVAPGATMTCPVAEALSRWTVDALTKEAERHLQQSPTKVLIGTSYECRNQRSGAKLSEHAFANAVDIMGFEFAKRGPLTVAFQPENSPEAAFQDAVRKGACSHFTTVLGPGSDAAHADHLHLDLRGRNGAYRICQ